LTRDRDEDYIAAMQEVLVSGFRRFRSAHLDRGKPDDPLVSQGKQWGFCDDDLYSVPGPLDLPTLSISRTPTVSIVSATLPGKTYWPVDLPVDVPLWDELKRTDVLLHVPYCSYEPVLRFVNDAATTRMCSRSR
jgi:polyphosphate kinase